MSSALKQVLENYPKYVIEKQKSANYVSIYTKNKSDIVVVYTRTKQPTTSIENNVKSENCVKEELDLTGSPLKLDLSLHMLDDTMISDEPQLWSKDEAVHQPIAVEKAMEIANFYNKILNEDPEDATPVWILVNPSSPNRPLLLTVQSDGNHFNRGIVTYEGCLALDDVDLQELVGAFAKKERISEDMVTVAVDCKYLLSGISYGSHSVDELLNAPHGGVTELACEWTAKTLITPYISCKVLLEQEVTVGHLGSPCNPIWKSVTALHNMNQLLVDMTVAGISAVNLETADIRTKTLNTKAPNNPKRLKELLNETETYAYTAECPAGGCICITDDTTTLKQCLTAMKIGGSSNDFTYKLWDILRDCETAQEVISLLLQALKFISSGKIRPFIDANNKTYLSKLVLKLSRGHSQATKVLKNLLSSPPQALSLVAQVGMEKTMWEYTRVISLLEHSFLLNTDNRSHETVEQINQTIQDMTMSGGNFTLNPFESLSTAELSIRLECESFYTEESHELTVDDFASVKKHGLVAEKKDVNEVPLIADEIDISPWKNLLAKFAQVHVCLEHLSRTETTLRANFENLKPIATRLLEHYVSEKSPVKTVGQLLNDPIQKMSMPITNNVVQEHLKKAAFWYRVEISRKEKAANMGLKRNSKTVHVFSQLPVFPPSVWHFLESESEDAAEVTMTRVGEEIKYYSTKYSYFSDEIKSYPVNFGLS